MVFLLPHLADVRRGEGPSGRWTSGDGEQPYRRFDYGSKAFALMAYSGNVRDRSE